MPISQQVEQFLHQMHMSFLTGARPSWARERAVRLSLVGFGVITIEVRVVVASINTFLDYAAAVGLPTGADRPPLAAEPEPVPAALLAAGARKAGAASRTALR